MVGRWWCEVAELMPEEARDGVGYGCLELKMLDCKPVATAVELVRVYSGGCDQGGCSFGKSHCL